MFYGRPVSPLAFELQSKPVHHQHQSSLFSRLSSDIRRKIYEYSFTHPTSKTNRDRTTFTAIPLLRTCRAIYLESFKLPLLLTPLQFHGPDLPTTPSLASLLPWQFALIQSLDITIQQNSPSPYLRDTIRSWRTGARHQNSYVIPRLFPERQTSEFHKFPTGTTASFNFGLIQASWAVSNPPTDGTHVVQSPAPFDIRPDDARPRNYTDGSMVARPLTHLTIRLPHSNWNTSKCDPGSRRHLSFDPALCYDASSSSSRSVHDLHSMLRLHARRRDTGRIPPIEKNSVCAVLNGVSGPLRTLDLVLEAEEGKEAQLREVVECAKAWAFKTATEHGRLVWEGVSVEKDVVPVQGSGDEKKEVVQERQKDDAVKEDVIMDGTTERLQDSTSAALEDRTSTSPTEKVVIRFTIRYKRDYGYQRSTHHEPKAWSDTPFTSDISLLLRDTSLMDVDDVEDDISGGFFVTEDRGRDGDYKEDVQLRWRRGVELRQS